MRRAGYKSRWTTTKAKFSRTKKVSVPSKTNPLPCEEVSSDVWTIAGVKRCCPFLGPCRTDIRNLLDPGRDKNEKDSHTKKPSEKQNKSRDQGQKICPEDYLKLDIDVSGYLSLQIVDSSFLAEADTSKSDSTPEPSKVPLVPYQSDIGDRSYSLVPYSDDDDDDDEGREMHSEDVRNETPSLATLQQDKWSRRSYGDADEGFHDDFCTCKQCRERHITSEGIDHLFDVETPEKTNSRKAHASELSTRSEADSAYWSLGSNRSTVFNTPRPGDTLTSYSRTLNDVESNGTTEVQEMTKRELLDMMLPPPPKEPCPLQLQVKFNKLFALKEKGLNLTELIKKNRNYQNPCLLGNHMEDYSTRSSSFDQSGTQCKRLRSLQIEWPRTYTP